jgi:hypothetical protein
VIALKCSQSCMYKKKVIQDIYSLWTVMFIHQVMCLMSKFNFSEVQYERHINT